MFKLNKLKTFMALLAFSALIWVSPTFTFAANTQTVMVLDGIRGESTNPIYKDGINIYGFSFGASNSGLDSSGNAGKATYSNVNLQKNMDAASLPLLKNLALGRSIAKGAIYFFNNSDQPYLVIRLKNIQVESLQLGGPSSDKLSESVSLKPSEMQFEFTPIVGPPGSKQTLDIDIDGNKAN